MKTIDQLLDDVVNSEKLKNDLQEALKGGAPAVEKFLKDNGYDGGIDNAKAYLAEKASDMKASGELTPEQLEQAAGGTVEWFLAPVFIAIGGDIALNVYNSCAYD